MGDGLSGEPIDDGKGELGANLHRRGEDLAVVGHRDGGPRFIPNGSVGRSAEQVPALGRNWAALTLRVALAAPGAPRRCSPIGTRRKAWSDCRVGRPPSLEWNPRPPAG